MSTMETAATQQVDASVSILQRFASWNRRLSEAITPAHYMQTHGLYRFYDVCLQQMVRADVRRVLDVGAGKTWHFPVSLKTALGLHLVGVDIDAAEMADNQALDEKLQADVVQGLPLDDASVDLVTVHWGIEHFADNDRFLAHCGRCLRPGGMFVAVFPDRNAPFALINRLLPPRLARKLLFQLRPESQGGFRAFYDRTTYAAFKQALERNGFRVTYYYPTFFSSGYFKSFVPVYLLSLAYDLLRFILGIRGLASFHLFVAEKR